MRAPCQVGQLNQIVGGVDFFFDRVRVLTQFALGEPCRGRQELPQALTRH
jgi:hypothetical protein